MGEAPQDAQQPPQPPQAESPPAAPPSEAQQGSPDLMSGLGQVARKVDAAHLKGQVNAVGWKQLEKIIMSMLGPYVNAENRDLMGQIAQFELRLSNMQGTNEQLEGHILGAKEDLDRIETEYSDLQKKAEAIRVEFKDQLAEFEKRVPELQAQAEQVEKARDEALSQVDGLEDHIRELDELKTTLAGIAAMGDPEDRANELEDQIRRLTELEAQLLQEVDYFDAGELYGESAWQEIAGGLLQRISALNPTSPEAQHATGHWAQIVQTVPQQAAQAAQAIDSLVAEMTAGEGTTDLMADLVRRGQTLRHLREQLRRVERGLDLVKATP